MFIFTICLLHNSNLSCNAPERPLHMQSMNPLICQQNICVSPKQKGHIRGKICPEWTDRARLPADFTISMLQYEQELALLLKQNMEQNMMWKSDLNFSGQQLTAYMCNHQHQKFTVWSDWIQGKRQHWQQLPDWVVREDLWAVIAWVIRPCVYYGPITYIRLFTKPKKKMCFL